jgi:C-terminal processing protease CtpA/Prc
MPVLNAQDVVVMSPAISSNGETIAFNYQGDIWTWNKQNGAKRLTIHEAYDHSPFFSEDGKHIAFGSNRYGNEDIFIIPMTGEQPKRITYRSSADRMTSWSNGQILFSSNRDFRALEWDSEVQIVSDKGGTPSRAMDAFGKYAALSPDGSKVVFVKGSCRIEREAYKGSANLDLWLYDLKTKTYKQLTTFEGNDFLPKWTSNEDIMFISARSGKYNIHSMNLASGKVSQVTKENKLGIYEYDVNLKSDVVYTSGLSLKMMKNGGGTEVVKLQLPADYRFDPVVSEEFSNGGQEYAISPNNESALVGIRGEIFATATEKDQKRTVNLSDHSYRDRDAAWLNDSTAIFASDRDGNYELYLAFSNDPNKPNVVESLKHGLKKLTNTAENERGPVVSPNGEKMVYMQGRQVVLVDIASNGKMSNKKVLMEGWNMPSDIQWSPDSKWIAYSRADLEFNYEIFIHQMWGDFDHFNVSMHPKRDSSPRWSADGTKLFFQSDRNNGDTDIWFAWLTEMDWLKANQDHEDGYYSEEKPSKSDKKKEKTDKSIQIDTYKIHDRLVQITSNPGTESIGGTDDKGEFVYFIAEGTNRSGRDLYKIKWNGEDFEAVTKNGQNPYGIQMADDGKYLYYISRGRLNRLKTSNDKSESVSFSARMKINYAEETKQLFNEAWRSMDTDFYDPDHHGRDWKALRSQWEPIALATSTRTDFQTIFNRMLGQLNASHMGLYSSDREDTQRERTGLLAVEIKPQSKGVEVLRVIPGGPAHRPQSRLYEGDVITHVNGAEITSTDNFYEHFSGLSNEEVLLNVKRKSGGIEEIAIRPQSSISDLLYEEWVASRQKLTEEKSGGKLGYIHIRGMNMPSFERFERELTAAGYGKDAIVIDVRWNGGGFTTDYLMAVLNVRQHAYTIPRGAAENLEKEKEAFRDYYPFSERLPLASWTRPSIALCNASSYSNAEIFSHAYKNLGIGTLVGQPTFGAVISTGSESMIDGSRLRKPFRGWFVKVDDHNMDMGGAIPDIIVPNAADYRTAGDAQLEKAISTMLEQ